MAVCCQNLTLGALSNGSALSMLVGALLKKFSIFLTTLESLCEMISYTFYYFRLFFFSFLDKRRSAVYTGYPAFLECCH
jgi:hypothetical protein